MRHRTRLVVHVGAVVVVLTASLGWQQAPVGYDDTPKQPWGWWRRIHHGARPQPRIVRPGTAGAMSPAPAPQDAVVLVGAGDDRSAWQMMDGTPVTWAMKNGVLETGKGLIRTRAEFTDVQLHVEFATPGEVKGDSQGRGNSGVFMLGKFEIQVLDSHQNPTYSRRSSRQRCTVNTRRWSTPPDRLASGKPTMWPSRRPDSRRVELWTSRRS